MFFKFLWPSKVIFRERGKEEQQGAIINVSGATQDKREFSWNLMVAEDESLITYGRPRRKDGEVGKTQVDNCLAVLLADTMT